MISVLRPYRMLAPVTPRSPREVRHGGLLAVGIVLATTATLLATDTTFARWFVSDPIVDQQVIVGDLNVALLDGAQASIWDISPDRAADGTLIAPGRSALSGSVFDPTRNLLSPGDAIAIVSQLQLKLQGENLVSSLGLTGLDIPGTTDWQYELYSGDTLIGSGLVSPPDASGISHIGFAASSRDPGSESDRDGRVKFELPAPESSITVVLTAKFAGRTSEYPNAQVDEVPLAKINFIAQQVRTVGAQYSTDQNGESS